MLENNKPNTARPGGTFETVPPDTRLQYPGVDQSKINGSVVSGNRPDPGAPNPFAFAASDLTLLTFPDSHDNCCADNRHGTLFSPLGGDPRASP